MVHLFVWSVEDSVNNVEGSGPEQGVYTHEEIISGLEWVINLYQFWTGQAMKSYASVLNFEKRNKLELPNWRRQIFYFNILSRRAGRRLRNKTYLLFLFLQQTTMKNSK